SARVPPPPSRCINGVASTRAPWSSKPVRSSAWCWPVSASPHCAQLLWRSCCGTSVRCQHCRPLRRPATRWHPPRLHLRSYRALRLPVCRATLRLSQRRSQRHESKATPPTPLEIRRATRAQQAPALKSRQRTRPRQRLGHEPGATLRRARRKPSMSWDSSGLLRILLLLACVLSHPALAHARTPEDSTEPEHREQA